MLFQSFLFLDKRQTFLYGLELIIQCYAKPPRQYSRISNELLCTILAQKTICNEFHTRNQKALDHGFDLEHIMLKALEEGFDLPETLKQALDLLYGRKTLDLEKM